MGAACEVSDDALRERLAAFYAAHWKRLWAYVVRLGAEPATAEDVAQDAFARWALSPAPGWDDGRARAYLYTIAHRALIDHRRRRRRDAPFPDDAEAPPASADLPLAGAWSKLGERERELLWLAYAEGFSHEEIAGIAGLRPASVRVLLSRARERARALLEGKEG